MKIMHSYCGISNSFFFKLCFTLLLLITCFAPAPVNAEEKETLPDLRLLEYPMTVLYRPETKENQSTASNPSFPCLSVTEDMSGGSHDGCAFGLAQATAVYRHKTDIGSIAFVRGSLLVRDQMPFPDTFTATFWYWEPPEKTALSAEEVIFGHYSTVVPAPFIMGPGKTVGDLEVLDSGKKLQIVSGRGLASREMRAPDYSQPSEEQYIPLDNLWQHIAVVYTSQNQKVTVYKNGIFAASFEGFRPTQMGYQYWTVGGKPLWKRNVTTFQDSLEKMDDQLWAVMDDFRIYPRELKQCEVDAIRTYKTCPSGHAIDPNDNCNCNPLCGTIVVKKKDCSPGQTKACHEIQNYTHTWGTAKCASNCSWVTNDCYGYTLSSVTPSDGLYPKYHLKDTIKVPLSLNKPADPKFPIKGIPIYRFWNKQGGAAPEESALIGQTDENGHILFQHMFSSPTEESSYTESYAAGPLTGTRSNVLRYSVSPNLIQANCNDRWKLHDHAIWVAPTGVDPKTGIFLQIWDRTKKQYLPTLLECSDKCIYTPGKPEESWHWDENLKKCQPDLLKAACTGKPDHSYWQNIGNVHVDSNSGEFNQTWDYDKKEYVPQVSQCWWKCESKRFKDGQTCINEKTITCPGIGDIYYDYTSASDLARYTCINPLFPDTCSWKIARTGEPYSPIIKENGDVEWPALKYCECLPGARHSAGLDPLTECVPMNTVDFSDKNLLLWLHKLNDSALNPLGVKLFPDSSVKSRSGENWYFIPEELGKVLVLNLVWTGPALYKGITISQIRYLGGLQHFSNLYYLNLSGHDVWDVSPLARLSETNFYDRKHESWHHTETPHLEKTICSTRGLKGEDSLEIIKLEQGEPVKNLADLSDEELAALSESEKEHILHLQRIQISCEAYGSWGGVLIKTKSYIPAENESAPLLQTNTYVFCNRKALKRDAQGKVIRDKNGNPKEYIETPSINYLLLKDFRPYFYYPGPMDPIVPYPKIKGLDPYDDTIGYVSKAEAIAVCGSDPIPYKLMVGFKKEQGARKATPIPLRTLDLSSNNLRYENLDAMSELYGLATLMLGNSNPKGSPNLFDSADYSVAFLSGLTTLQYLDLHDTGIPTMHPAKKDKAVVPCQCKEKILSSNPGEKNEFNCFPDMQLCGCTCANGECECDKTEVEVDNYLFRTLGEVTYLDLSGNRIEDISGIEYMTSLQGLDITGNKIWEIGSLGKNTTLRWLYMSDNLVSSILPLGSLMALEAVEADNNRVASLAGLLPMFSLRKLHLANNAKDLSVSLAGLESLSYSDYLEDLNLAGNRLETSDITPLGKLKNLQSLHLEDNYLADLDSLLDIPNLAFVWLSGNCIPIEKYLPIEAKGIVIVDKIGGFRADCDLCATPAAACDPDTAKDCAALLGHGWTGSALCNRRCAGFDTSECEYEENDGDSAPDTDTGLIPDQSGGGSVDTEKPDTDSGSSGGGEEEKKRSAACINGNERKSLSNSFFCLCNEDLGYHAVYLGHDRWMCAQDENQQPEMEPLRADDPQVKALECTLPLSEQCLDEEYQQTACGKLFANRNCRVLVMDGISNSHIDLDADTLPDTDNIVEKQFMYYQIKSPRQIGVTETANTKTDVSLPQPELENKVIGHSTFAGFLKNTQGVYFNFVKPVMMKFIDAPVTKYKKFGTQTVKQDFIRQFEFSLGSADEIWTAGAKEFGWLSIPLEDTDEEPDTPEESDYLPPIIPVKLDVAIERNPYFFDRHIKISEKINQLDQIKKIDTLWKIKDFSEQILLPARKAVWSSVGFSPDKFEVVDSDLVQNCTHYTFRKYYDYTRYLEYAAGFIDRPVDLIIALSENEKLFLYNGKKEYTKAQTGYYPHTFCNGMIGAAGRCDNIIHPETGDPQPPLEPQVIIKRPKNFFQEATSLFTHYKDDNCDHVQAGQSPHLCGFTGIMMDIPEYANLPTLVEDLSFYYEMSRDYTELRKQQIALVKAYRERFTRLIFARANVELMWNEKQLYARESGNDAHYDIQWISPVASLIVLAAADARDTSHISRPEDISDQDIINAYLAQEYSYALAVAAMRYKVLTEKQQQILNRVRDTRFEETPAAKKLWSRYHYGKEEYLAKQGAGIETYPRGDTEALIEKVLAEIDGQIDLIIKTVSGMPDHTIDWNYPGEGMVTSLFPVDCFDLTPDMAGDCDWIPEDFSRRMAGFIPTTVMEKDFQRCVAVTRDETAETKEANEFSRFGILSHHPMYETFNPEWMNVYYALFGTYDYLSPRNIYDAGLARLGDEYENGVVDNNNTIIKEGLRSLGAYTMAGYWDFSIFSGRPVWWDKVEFSKTSEQTSEKIPLIETNTPVSNGKLLFDGTNNFANLKLWQDLSPEKQKEDGRKAFSFASLRNNNPSFAIHLTFKPDGSCSQSHPYSSLASFGQGWDPSSNIMFETGCVGDKTFFLRMHAEYGDGSAPKPANNTVILTLPKSVASYTENIDLVAAFVATGSADTSADHRTKLVLQVYHNGDLLETADNGSNLMPKWITDRYGDVTDFYNGLHLGALLNDKKHGVRKAFFKGTISRFGVYKGIPESIKGIAVSNSEAKSILSYPVRVSDTRVLEAFIRAERQKAYPPLKDFGPEEEAFFKTLLSNPVYTTFKWGANTGAYTCSERKPDTEVHCFYTPVPGIEDEQKYALINQFTFSKACNNQSGKNIDFTISWKCLDQYINMTELWQIESEAIQTRMKEIKEKVKEKKDQETIELLKRVMGMAPPDPAVTGDDPILKAFFERDSQDEWITPKPKTKDIKKYFSEYQAFGSDYAGVNYSYIAGAGLYNALIDWNDFNPLPDLKKVEPLLGHLSRELINTLAVIARDSGVQSLSDFENLGQEIANISDSLNVNPQAVMDELMARFARVPRCMTDPNEFEEKVRPAGKDVLAAMKTARLLFNAIQKLTSIFRGFNPDNMLQGLTEMMPDVNAEQFLYAFVDDLTDTAFRDMLAGYDDNAKDILTNANIDANKILSAVANDKAKLRSFIADAKKKEDNFVDNMQRIRSLLEFIKTLPKKENFLTAFFDTGSVTDTANHILGSLSEHVLLSFLDINLEITVNVDGQKQVISDVRGKILEAVRQSKALEDQFKNLISNQGQIANGAFAQWVAATAIGKDAWKNYQAALIKITSVSTFKTPESFATLLQQMQELPMPEFVNLEADIIKTQLVELLKVLKTPLKEMLTTIEAQARNIPLPTGAAAQTVEVTISFRADAELQLPRLDTGMVESAVMGIFEQKIDTIKGFISDIIGIFKGFAFPLIPESGSVAGLSLSEFQLPKVLVEIASGNETIKRAFNLTGDLTKPKEIQAAAEQLLAVYAKKVAAQFNVFSEEKNPTAEILTPLVQTYFNAVKDAFAFNEIQELLENGAPGMPSLDFSGLVKEALFACIGAEVFKEDLPFEVGFTSSDVSIAPYRALFEKISVAYKDTPLLSSLASHTGEMMSAAKDALFARLMEIVKEKLLKLPYAELIAHGQSSIMFFGHEENLFEVTNYLSTKPDRCLWDDVECGNVIQLDDVKPGAKNWFVKQHGKEIRPFVPFQRYYAIDISTSLEDVVVQAASMAGSALLKKAGLNVPDLQEALKNAAKGDFEKLGEAGMSALKQGMNELQKKLDQEMDKANNSKKENNPEDLGTKYVLIDTGIGDSYTFVIVVVPVVIGWGVGLEAGVYVQAYASYGMNVKNKLTGQTAMAGLTAGLGITPYLIADGFLAAGIGFGFAGFELALMLVGHVEFVNFKAPFNAQLMLMPEFTEGIAVNLYLGATLKPKLDIFDADLRFLASLKIPVLGKLSYEKVIADFPPLISMDFGNVLPVPPLKIDLLKLAKGINAR